MAEWAVGRTGWSRPGGLGGCVRRLWGLFPRDRAGGGGGGEGAVGRSGGGEGWVPCEGGDESALRWCCCGSGGGLVCVRFVNGGTERGCGSVAVAREGLVGVADVFGFIEL